MVYTCMQYRSIHTHTHTHIDMYMYMSCMVAVSQEAWALSASPEIVRCQNICALPHEYWCRRGAESGHACCCPGIFNRMHMRFAKGRMAHIIGYELGGQRGSKGKTEMTARRSPADACESRPNEILTVPPFITCVLLVLDWVCWVPSSWPLFPSFSYSSSYSSCFSSPPSFSPHEKVDGHVLCTQWENFLQDMGNLDHHRHRRTEALPPWIWTANMLSHALVLGYQGCFLRRSQEDKQYTCYV